MSNLEKLLEQKKPDLSKASIKAYSICLNKLYKLYCQSSSKFKYSKDDEINLNFLQNTKRILALIKDEPITTRKNRLTCIVVFLKAMNAKENVLKVYFDEMIKVAKEYQDWLKEQKKTDKQRENWLTQDELDDIINNLYNEVKDYKAKETLKDSEYNNLQVYTLLRLLDKFSIRNEFGSMKRIVKPTENKTENYMISNKQIVLNKFKTKKFLGSKTYNIEKPLQSILKILFKFNKSPYVFTKTDRETELGSHGITLLLTNFFKRVSNKKISTSMLRHIQATRDEADKPTILEQEKKDAEIRDKYLHNEYQHKLYAKKD